eukprot:7333175-Pyramimonas_sp.AAC.1
MPPPPSCPSRQAARSLRARATNLRAPISQAPCSRGKLLRSRRNRSSSDPPSYPQVWHRNAVNPEAENAHERPFR